MHPDSNKADFRELFKRSLGKISEIKAKLSAVELARIAPIAIVGMGCRYPGGAKDPTSYWQLLREGVDGIRETALRWPKGSTTEQPEIRWAGLLDHVDQFDASFFGISPREAVKLDPQQRLLLEVSWEALEDAGYPPQRLMGSRTGIFLGLSSNEYREHLAKREQEPDIYEITGNGSAYAAGRISYVLGLEGPSLIIDTVCSSSLVAIHLACQSLRNEECELALAGGVNLILSPSVMELYLSLQALSPDGRCKTFDASANGFVRGEGCGIVVLKRLSEAQRDKDPIWALIRGSAVNQDGRSTGLTAPNVLAQQALLRQALERARVSAQEISYVEAHGTGTSLGDPIEVEALKEVLGQPREDGSTCALGAVKTNLGHLEAAAGVAGLMKVVLALKHQRIPKNLHFRALNPRISLQGTPFLIPTQALSWPLGPSPRRAGISAFGLSGTNAHLILEEAPQALPPPESQKESPEEPRPALLVLSAKSEEALREQAKRYAEHLSSHSKQELNDICYTAAVGRSHFPYRLAVAGRQGEELCGALLAHAEARQVAGLVVGERKARRGVWAFLFTGQGSQYAGMGEGLYQAWPTFRGALDRCAEALKNELPKPLLEVMWAEAGSQEAALLDQTGYAQVALFALEYSLCELWRSFGVEPALLLGHSLGELVAACVAGVFSLQDALRLVVARGRLMQALPPGGAMLSLEATEAQALEAIAPYAAEVSLGALNGPRQVVLSGVEGVLLKLAASLEARGVHTRRLKVSHAFHSPLMEPILGELRLVAQGISYHKPKLPLVSNLSGKLAGEEMATPEYWVSQVRGAVRFREGIEALHQAGADTFVEIGPRPTLLGLLPSCLPEKASLTLLSSLRPGREESASLLEALGGWYTSGGEVQWKGLFPSGGQRVPLPTYPFQRQRYWFEAPPATASFQGGTRVAGPSQEPAYPCQAGCSTIS